MTEPPGNVIASIAWINTTSRQSLPEFTSSWKNRSIRLMTKSDMIYLYAKGPGKVRSS